MTRVPWLAASFVVVSEPSSFGPPATPSRLEMMFAPATRGVGHGSMNTPPPLPLEPGETVVLSGGRSWHCWLYTLALSPLVCSLLFAPLVAVPLLISGQYWLTQRRLIFKAPMREAKAVTLSTITTIDLVASRATMTLRFSGGDLTLRFAEGFARLWGALSLLTELPVPSQVAPAQQTFRASPATAKFPGGWQQGFAVNCNQRLVFLPNERPRSNVAEAGKLAGQLALALVGVHVHRAQAQLPFDLWLSLWSHLPATEFDTLLAHTAETRGGRVLDLHQLEVQSPQRFGVGEWSVSTRHAVL